MVSGQLLAISDNYIHVTTSLVTTGVLVDDTTLVTMSARVGQLNKCITNELVPTNVTTTKSSLATSLNLTTTLVITSLVDN